MMYWIVFAFFTCIETFTDIFLSWFPFYYEVKVVIVLWLLSPATKGSSTLYRKFVHPMLTRREQVGSLYYIPYYTYIYISTHFLSLCLAGNRWVFESGTRTGILGSAAAGIQGRQLCHKRHHADGHKGNSDNNKSTHITHTTPHTPIHTHTHTDSSSNSCGIYFNCFYNKFASSVVA